MIEGIRWLISTGTRMIHGQLSVCRMMVKAQVAVELYRYVYIYIYHLFIIILVFIKMFLVILIS